MRKANSQQGVVQRNGSERQLRPPSGACHYQNGLGFALSNLEIVDSALAAASHVAVRLQSAKPAPPGLQTSLPLSRDADAVSSITFLATEPFNRSLSRTPSNTRTLSSNILLPRSLSQSPFAESPHSRSIFTICPSSSASLPLTARIASSIMAPVVLSGLFAV